MKPNFLSLILAGVALLAACAEQPLEVEVTSSFDVPFGFPPPRIPDDNPLTDAKIELGRHLFYDTRMSLDGTFSCASCHRQELAFTDGLPRGQGVTGELHPRGAMSLTNVAYAVTFNWVSPVERRLETQALTPMFGETPVELGLSGREDILLDSFEDDPKMRRLFDQAFDDADPVSVANIAKALASFERTLISASSPYDEWVRGERNALSDSAKRGRELFFSEKLECFHCHGGFNFTDTSDHDGLMFIETPFHNNGLYNINNQGDYPADNQGLYVFTQRLEDRGKFKAPTLRNIGMTAPYMHDGSIQTLSEVIDHYAAGGRNTEEGLHQGDGRKHPNKSIFVNGFVITPSEREDLLAFLHSLTDQEFLTNPSFANPWLETP